MPCGLSQNVVAGRRIGQFERAALDRGQAGVGVGRGEGQCARAGLGQSAVRADDAISKGWLIVTAWPFVSITAPPACTFSVNGRQRRRRW